VSQRGGAPGYVLGRRQRRCRPRVASGLSSAPRSVRDMTTLPPPPAPADEPSGQTTTFPPPSGPQILRAVRAATIGYAWLLLGAVVVMILIVVAANIGSTADATGVESNDTNGIGVLIGMPFQIAGMALLGPLHFTADGVSAWFFFPPLLLTALFVLMTARAARRGDVIPATGTRALLSIITGFLAAVVITLASWALAMRADGSALHTASVSLFFGTWVLTGGAVYAGSTRVAGVSRPAWIPADYPVAARVWMGSVVAWLAAALVILTIVAAVKVDLWVAILVPVWGVTLGLDAYAIGHLGGLSFGGDGIGLGDFGAAWTILMVVGALALAVLSSIAWHLRRDGSESWLAQPGSWAALPATYAAGGLLIWLVPSVVLGGAMGEFGASTTLQPAFWFVFVLTIWGAAVEAGSRFVAPSLATALPPRLHALLRGPERLPASSTGNAAVPVDAQPLTPEERARYKKIGILAGAGAALLIVGLVAVSVANSQFFGPEKQAEAYLDAVVAGELDAVTELAPTDGQADDSLLTSKVYEAAGSRITGYEIRDVTNDGGTVTVSVKLEGLRDSTAAELTLQKDGKRGLVFDRWRVADGGLATVVSLFLPDGSDELTVNGEDVGTVDSDVWLLPGDYVFDAFAGSQWLDSPDEPFTVVADEDYQLAEVPYPTASEAFRQEVQRQVDAYMADCIASTELEPAGCPNQAYGGYGDVRNVSWTLDAAPTPDFDMFDGSFPADLSYGDSGSATVTYEEDESYGFGRRDWQPQTEQVDLYLDEVTVTEEGGALVVSIGG